MLTATTLSRLLTACTEKHPESICFRFLAASGTVEMSVGELHRRALAIARLLAEKAHPGDRVLVVANPGEDFVAGLFGCLYAGLVAVPVSPPRQGRALHRLSLLVRHARARIALVSTLPAERLRSQLAESLEGQALEWLATSSTPDEPQPLDRTPTAVSPDSVAVIQYTSGSTSDPKGVVLTHAAILANVDALIERAKATHADRIVSWLPTYHDMGLISGVLFPLRLGAVATLLSPGDFMQRPMSWLQAISTYRGTISGCSNFGYDLCVKRATPEQRAALDLSSWRIAFSGAERVHAVTLEQFANAFEVSGFRARAFCSCYGLAEATVGVTFPSPEDEPVMRAFDPEGLSRGVARGIAAPGASTTRLVGAGRALPGMLVRIRDPETGGPLADGRVGEICVQGPSVALGYLDAPEATRNAFWEDSSPTWPGRWLRTGDLGFLLDGELFITGRSKDLIICRGVNHCPEDIEYTVATTDERLRLGTTAAFSVEIGDEERLVLVQEIDPASVDLGALSTAVRTEVAAAHGLQVHDLVFVRTGTLPRTTSGKVQRGVCRESYLADSLTRAGRPRDNAPARARRLTTEAATSTIAQTMAELLERDRVDAAEDFFALGGHSLLATQLVSRLQGLLGLHVPVRAVFEAPSPRALAAYAAGLGADADTEAVVPIDRSKPLPLSFSQERMWVLHELDPESSAYNVAGGAVIDGPLEPALLQLALDHLVRGHETLRSNYPNVDGVPQVVIRDGLHIDLSPISLEQEVAPMCRAQELGSRLAQAPFDLGKEPLLRAELYRLAPERHMLAICMHHIISDAWSMGVLGEQLAQTYGALRLGKPLPSPPPVGYVDFAAYQRKLLTSKRLEPGIAYFRSELQGARVLELPTDHPRKPGSQPGGALEQFEIGAEEWRRLREFAVAAGVTPFMVLLSAFAIVLHRYSGDDDIVVGVPIANRNHLAAEQVIGTLVNTLPIRVRIEAGMSGEDLLRRVSNLCLNAYTHQDVPFEYLVRELDIERLPGRAPLVQVMLDYQNTRMNVREFAGLTASPCVLERRATQFDISLLIADNAFSQTCGIEYNRDLFEPVTIQRLCRSFVNILRGLRAEPSCAVGGLKLLDVHEVEAILKRDRETCLAAESGLRVTSKLTYWAQQTPNACAVIDEKGSLSYAELRDRVDAIAGRLQTLGVGAGDRVIVCLERSKEILVALLAVLELGGTYIPLDPRYPADRLAYVVENSNPKAAITTRALLENQWVGADVRSLCLDEPAPLGAVFVRPAPQPSHSSAYMIYTSGSTGRPKGVEIPLAALGNFLESMLIEPGLTRDDRWLSVTTVSFDIAALELFLPIVAGACVYIASVPTTMDGAALTKAIVDFDATVMQATPATWRLLIDSGWRGHPSLTMLCGGEALPSDLADALLSRGRALWNMYGPTETTIWSTVHRVERGDVRIPIGHPIRNTIVHVLDDHLAPVPDGVAGELWIGGDGLATGYFRRPDLTAERFVRDPSEAAASGRMYRTGDRGRRRYDGLLECMGRVDHQVKVRGYRIEPGEIESVLKDQNALQDAVVVARNLGDHDCRLLAYVVATNPREFNAAEAVERLRSVLPDYMIPTACVVLPTLPRTPNGKLDRAALPVPTLEDLRGSADTTSPRDALERRLAEIWSALLGVPEIHVKDSFFHLGGHSLLAVRALALVKKEWGVELQVIDLLQHPTLEQFADILRKGLARSPRTNEDAKWKYLVPVAKGGQGVVLYCIHGADGGIAPFFHLAKHLGKRCGVVGFQARGVDGRQPPHESIEEMSTEYLAELRAHAPKGPYHLVGYCGGGTVAYEIALRLLHEGEEVRLLALIDTYRPGIRVDMSRWESWADTFHQGGADGIVERVVRAARYRMGYARRLFSVAWSRWRDDTIPIELREFALMRSYMSAVRTHRVRKYPGKLFVLRASQARPELALAAPDLGWTDYAEGGVEIVNIPGTHEGVVREPNIEHMARELERHLEAVATPRRGVVAIRSRDCANGKASLVSG